MREVKITKGGNKGGRRTEKKFGEHPNSIAGQLTRLSPELRARYRRNRQEFEADRRFMEAWAANDFEGGAMTNEYDDNPDKDSLDRDDD